MRTIRRIGALAQPLSTRGRLVVMVAAVVLAVPVATAGACSCAGGDPRPRLSRADAAFVGSVTSARRVPGAAWSRAVEYVFSVERSYKGNLGTTVSIRTSDNEASCGLGLRDGERVGLLLRSDGGGWTAGLCDLMTPAELERATEPYPRGRGRGAARLLVTGPFHDAGLAALDGRGRLIGWVFGSEGDVVGACPGSRYAVQAGDDLSVIRMHDLRLVDRRSLPGDWTHAVRCLDARGEDVVAATFRFGQASERKTIVRVRDGRLQATGTEKAVEVLLGRSHAFLAPSRGRGKAPIIAISHRDGTARRIGAPARWSELIALSPDGRRIAGIEGYPRGRLRVIGLGSGRSRSRRVVAEWSRPVWLDSERLAVPGPRGRSAVFDLRLRRLATLPGWDTTLTAVAGDTMWWVTHEGELESLDTARGAMRRVAAPPLAGAAGLDALPRPAEVTAAARRAPRTTRGEGDPRPSCGRARAS